MSCGSRHHTMVQAPLVWVTVGKTQHPALLYEIKEGVSLVEWTSTHRKEWVDSNSIEHELSPRSRRRRFPVEQTNIASRQKMFNAATATTSSPSRPPKRSKVKKIQHDKTDQSELKSIENGCANSGNLRSASIITSHTIVKSTQDSSRVVPDCFHEQQNKDDVMDQDNDFSTETPLIDLLQDSDTDQSDKGTDSDNILLLTLLSKRLPSNIKEPSYRSNSTKNDVISLPTPVCRPVSHSPTNDDPNLNMFYAVPSPMLDTNSKCLSTVPTKSFMKENYMDSSSSTSAPSIRYIAATTTNVDNLHVRTRSYNAEMVGINAAMTPQYSLRESIYLQNLAELCFIILMDYRWCVGKRMESLFRWEYGEDLSIVTALSRHYIPRGSPRSLPCRCLLCPNESKVAVPTTSANTTIQENGAMESEIGTDPVKIENDTDEVRGLYIYSRLYYRKGPWFRMDDIYNRYYTSKKYKREGGCTDSTEDNVSGSKKFTFRSVSVPATETKTVSSNGKSTSFDKALLKIHVEKIVPRFLRDLDGLYRSGAVRAFANEEECGKIVGESLLTTEERLIIMSKLGAGKKKERKQVSLKVTSNGSENSIWRQMSRQKSILTVLESTGEKSLLPVRRHVGDLVLEKLANVIVHSCHESKENIPAHVIRTYVQDVVKCIRTLVQTKFHSLNHRFCFRLREEPAGILQRCCRLYLCATLGPGDMRSSATNGWKSLLDTKFVELPPLARAIPPPGVHTWHQIQYPGIAHVFGLSSACFMDAYKLLPRDYGSSNPMEQIFFNRNSFLLWELCVELRSNVDYLLELNEALRYNQRREARGKDPFFRHGKSPENGSVDFLNLLKKHGLESMLNKFLQRESDTMEKRIDVYRDIEVCQSKLESECERVLGIVGVVALHVLRAENIGIPGNELNLLVARPWLRHLSWQGCMTYLLWDIIPIFERRGLYLQSIKCLELLLFGSFSTNLNIPEPTILAPLLLSRRARGKAVDRLIIDHGHLHRQSINGLDKNKKKAASLAFQANLVSFCLNIIRITAPSASLGFSSIRNIARRLRQPLAVSLNDFGCAEATELGLRLENDGERVKLSARRCNQYTDWVPTADRTVANALKNEENGPGARCAFVGFEDEDKASSGSLNVEELAMELYRSGRLPVDQASDCSGGGWMGWHDEGGHVRALFRILCSAPILGMDFGCSLSGLSEQEKTEYSTIHLSPYQTAPFDLHVGFERRDASRGFLSRRNARIRSFLLKLAALNDQNLSDLVHDSVAARMHFMYENMRRDAFLERDVAQLRTLSALAAGFGGVRLADIFRCFFFDYRHYSGGLPDLHLFRAISVTTISPNNGAITLIDLGEWIGESFSPEHQQAIATKQLVTILSDRDDEYLGCSKIGDSGGQARLTSRGGHSMGNTQSKASQNATIPTASPIKLPERLLFSHNGSAVQVQCLMVEVKSSNDRLDARQEDWLNVLDRYGMARVCKFEDKMKKKSRKAPFDENTITTENEC